MMMIGGVCSSSSIRVAMNAVIRGRGGGGSSSTSTTTSVVLRQCCGFKTSWTTTPSISRPVVRQQTASLLMTTRLFSASPIDVDVEDEDSVVDDVVSNTSDHAVTALILGKPGGGKGTISGKILKDFPNFTHISTGDLLRQHVRQQTALGKEAKTFMDSGGLVPNELMIRLVLEEAPQHDQNSLLLDGFPRTMEQAQALDKSDVHVDFVINLNIPTETIVERISDRWIHAPSGRVYSYSYKPPLRKGLDDVTGEPLVQRSDDEPKAVRQRLEAYDKITSPLIQYYSDKGILQTFSGTKSDVIYPVVKQYLITKLQEEEENNQVKRR